MSEDKLFTCACGKSFKKENWLNAHKRYCKSNPDAEKKEQKPEPDKPKKRKFTSLSNDIKWMYVQMGGRDQLLLEAQNDPKFFKMLVEVMLRDEQKVKETQSGKKDEQGNTFFIIKGLQVEGKTTEDIDADVKKFRASVLPEEREFQEEEFVADEHIEEDNG